jgi:hypothetical protein
MAAEEPLEKIHFAVLLSIFSELCRVFFRRVLERAAEKHC